MTYRRALAPGSTPTIEGNWRETDVSDYWVSDDGRVWSAKSDKLISQQHRHERGYAQVCLRTHGGDVLRYVHSLILTAFIGPRPDGYVACHIDGHPENNTLENLMWGTYTDNANHKVAHGRHHNAVKDRCPQGHSYDGDNLYMAPRSDGTVFRQCRECVRINGANYRARKRHAGNARAA